MFRDGPDDFHARGHWLGGEVALSWGDRLARSAPIIKRSVEEFLAGNARFCEEEFSAHASYYRHLARGQRPRLLWIGCSDSRIPESIITSSRPGEIFVHRNIANIISFNDVNIAAIIEYALKHLRIPDIVVCGHYGCGGIAALERGIHDTYIADWLLIASGARTAVDKIAERRRLDPERRLRLLVEENVKLQIRHLASFAMIRQFHRRGPTPRLHGWTYDIATGKIRVLVRHDPTAAAGVTRRP